MVGLVLRYAPLYRDLRAAQADGHARRDRLDRGLRTHPALSRRLLHARLAPLRALFRQLHAGEMLPRPRSLQRRHRRAAGARRELRRPQELHPGERPGAQGINDLEVFHRKPSGWMGSDKVFDSDGDIIDYQVAIVEYANGVGDELPHQSQRARRVPPLLRSWAPRGMAEGDFVRNYFNVHDDADRQHGWSTTNTPAPSCRSTTAPTSRWRATSSAHVCDGRAAAGLGGRCAGSRASWRSRWTRRGASAASSICRPIWDRFDDALARQSGLRRRQDERSTQHRHLRLDPSAARPSSMCS